MAMYRFVRFSALELHALRRYPGSRQIDRQNDRQKHQQIPYAFAAHAHRGIKYDLVSVLQSYLTWMFY